MSLQRSLRTGLLITGAAAAVAAVLMLPTIIITYVAPSGSVPQFVDSLPGWVVTDALGLSGIRLFVAGALCALLLLSGGRGTRVIVLLASVWLGLAMWTILGGPYWWGWMDQFNNSLPVFVKPAGDAAVLLLLAVLAFLAAGRWRQQDGTLVEQARQPDAPEASAIR